MKAKTIIAAAVTLSAMIFLALMLPRWREHQLIRQSLPIQASLESDRQQHGYYPDSLERIGMVERLEGPIHYERESESTYRLWFGTTFGESLIYLSADGKWQ